MIYSIERKFLDVRFGELSFFVSVFDINARYVGGVSENLELL